MKKYTVNVIGLGYVGLPTAAFLAQKGHQVNGVDIREDVVSKINAGEVHIIEPDLEGLVRMVVENGHLRANRFPQEADVHVIAVPTPIVTESRRPKMDYVEAAIDSIIPVIKEGDSVILESTSPVGTTEAMFDRILQARSDLKPDKFFMAYCPERILPGKTLYELEHNDRTIGGINPESTKKVADFYAVSVQGHLQKTNARTAELSKLVENSFRDVNIAFANEISMIAEVADINASEVIDIVNKHPRVNVLTPGPGVGGHCIAIDPWFIVDGFPKESKVILSARERNLEKTEWVIQKIENAVQSHSAENPVVAVFGLAYKPDIDDLRESPAFYIYERLRQNGLNVLAIEPNIKQGKNIDLVDANVAIEEADILVFLVKHSTFMEIKPMLKDSKGVHLDFCGLLYDGMGPR